MPNEALTMMDLLIEAHIGLERQGPGSPEITKKALSFLENPEQMTHVADLACGTGGQTMTLAQGIAGTITGVDICPAFIDVFNENARKANLQGRVQGIVGDMESLPFAKKSLDLIWCEGAIDQIGFERGLREWRGFLKPNGYLAATCPAWLTEKHPAEVERFWTDAGSRLDTIAYHTDILQSAGYRFIAAFALPNKCWTEHYLLPRAAAESAMQKKYGGNQTAASYFQEEARESALYAKHKQHYGYVFYIGQKNG